MEIIIIYCYIEILGGWILNLLKLPSNIGLMIMQILDLVPFLVIPFLYRVKKSLLILPNTITFWIIVTVFGILSVFTTLYHNGNIISVVSHFGAIFRFVPLALMIWLLKPTVRDIQRFYTSFVVLSILLLIIGYIEIFLGDAVREIFTPLTQSHSSANNQELEDINGIFPNTVDYSYYLLISYIIISNRFPLKHQFICFISYALPLFFSGSKGALLLLLLCGYYKLKNAKILKWIFVTTIATVSSILLYQFWDLFYWTVFIDSQSSRLGYIIFTFPCFLQELSLDTFIGVSPDSQIVFEKINSYPNAPMMTWEIESMGSFEDEFYVAMPVYYGLIGFMFILILFIGMYRGFIHTRWKDTLFNYPIIIKSLFTILLIAPLFNQIIIIKPFTIFFWCWIGILLTRMSHPSTIHSPKEIYE